MLGRRFSRIVEECLHRLDRGEDLPDVLADYPVESEQLKPLLLIAMASRTMAFPVPSQTAQRLGKIEMLIEMDQPISHSLRSGSDFGLRIKNWATHLLNTYRARNLIQPVPSYRLALISLVVIFGSGLFFLSASASPGDLFTAFSVDLQNVMTILNQGLERLPFTETSMANRTIKISGGEALPKETSGTEKVAILLDAEEISSGYVYVNPYEERYQYRWGETTGVEESLTKDDTLSKKDLMQAEKDQKKAEKAADKEASKSEREAEKTLRQAELEDKIAQIKELIEAKQEEKILEKEEKEKD